MGATSAVPTSNEDALNALRACGEDLPDDLREQILAVGAEAVPALVTILEDEELALVESPGEGWPPIHAADLLVELRATDAIPSLVRTLASGDADEVLQNRIAVRLPKLGQAVLEPALDEVGRVDDLYLRQSLWTVLAKLGVPDERIYQGLSELFDEDETLGAICFGHYGDPRALPLLEQAIRDFEPDHEGRIGIMGLAELVAAHERLGGVLPDELKAKVARIREEWSKRYERRFVRGVPVTSTKVGRNDPCPCGSGKKYKKCCLGA